MVQLVGYQIGGRAPARPVTADDVEQGVPRPGTGSASSSETALNDLSEVDRQFLTAMAVDDGPSRVADIARRMDKGSQYVNTYRGRLAAAGVIESPARGRVDFSIPYLRDTLRDTLGEAQLTVVSSWVARVSTT